LASPVLSHAAQAFGLRQRVPSTSATYSSAASLRHTIPDPVANAALLVLRHSRISIEEVARYKVAGNVNSGDDFREPRVHQAVSLLALWATD